jgi:hypothetical protein
LELAELEVIRAEKTAKKLARKNNRKSGYGKPNPTTHYFFWLQHSFNAR